jgi:integrase
VARDTPSVDAMQSCSRILRDRMGKAAPDRLVFPGADGFLKNYELRKVFDPAATRASLNGLAPHELRHTCASLAIRGAGASIKAVQTMLGHKTATMTPDTYGSLYKGDLDEVAQRMGAGCVYRVRTGSV